MQVEESTRWAKGKFEKIGLENPQHNAEILLGYVLGKKWSELYLLDEEIPEESLNLFKIYVKKRCMNMPVAVSTSFCLPVKKGWHFEHISILMFCFVDLVWITSPQAQVIVVSLYSG